jgi:hypothetical protein
MTHPDRISHTMLPRPNWGSTVTSANQTTSLQQQKTPIDPTVTYGSHNWRFLARTRPHRVQWPSAKARSDLVPR